MPSDRTVGYGLRPGRQEDGRKCERSRHQASRCQGCRVYRLGDATTFVKENADSGAKVGTDDAVACESLPVDHETVECSLSECVTGDIARNGIESLWSIIKRVHEGGFQKFSLKYLDRYVQEFAMRCNFRELDSIAPMPSMRGGIEGKRLRYQIPIAKKGLSSGTRS